MNLDDQLRHAIHGCGTSVYRLSLNAGLSPSQLSLFLNRKRGLSLMVAGKVVKALGLRLAPVEKGKA